MASYFPFQTLQACSVLRWRLRRLRCREVFIFTRASVSGAFLYVQPARLTHQAWRHGLGQQCPPSAVGQFKFPAQPIRPGATTSSRHLDWVWSGPVWTSVHWRIVVRAQQLKEERSVLSARLFAGQQQFRQILFWTTLYLPINFGWSWKNLPECMGYRYC